jgi:hypothetical protein
MSDILFPVSARVTNSRWDIASNTAAARSIFTGAVRTIARTGDRFRIGLNISNANNRESFPIAAALRSLRASLGGQANRIWLSDPGYTPRGSFPAPELLVNNTFASGTNGWSSSRATLSNQDRILRATISDGPSSPLVSQFPVIVTAYVPYCLRVFVKEGRGAELTAGYWRSLVSDSTFSTSSALVDGMNRSTLSMDNGITGTVYILNPVSGVFPVGSLVGDYFDFHYTSLARCFLVDNGPNYALFSDQIDNAAWTKVGASVTANAGEAPDRNSTADYIVEDATTSTHSVEQTITVPSGITRVTVSAMLKQINRRYGRLEVFDGSNNSIVWVDLTFGVIGVTSSTGTTFDHEQAFVQNMGNGWFWLTLVTQKTNATPTSLTIRIGGATSAGGLTYTGTASNQSIAVWRAGFALSAHPVRHAQTTSSALSAGSLQNGSRLNVCGLPVNTNGLLLPGDRVQIGTQLNTVTSPLNSNALGIGDLQCAIPWRNSPANGDAVIVNNPMARCVLTDNVGGWSNRPGGFNDFEFEFEEALDS